MVDSSRNKCSMDVLLRNITLKFSNKFDVFFKFISSNFHHEALNTKSEHIVVDLTTTDWQWGFKKVEHVDSIDAFILTQIIIWCINHTFRWTSYILFFVFFQIWSRKCAQKNLCGLENYDLKEYKSSKSQISQ